MVYDFGDVKGCWQARTPAAPFHILPCGATWGLPGAAAGLACPTSLSRVICKDSAYGLAQACPDTSFRTSKVCHCSCVISTTMCHHDFYRYCAFPNHSDGDRDSHIKLFTVCMHAHACSPAIYKCNVTVTQSTRLPSLLDPLLKPHHRCKAVRSARLPARRSMLRTFSVACIAASGGLASLIW